MGKELEVLNGLNLPIYWAMTNYAGVIKTIDLKNAKPFKSLLENYGITINNPKYLKYLSMNKKEQDKTLMRIKVLTDHGEEINDENTRLIFDPVAFSIQYPQVDIDGLVRKEYIEKDINTNEDKMLRYMDLTAKLRTVIETVYFTDDVPEELNEQIKAKISEEGQLSDANILMQVFCQGRNMDETEISNLKSAINYVITQDINKKGRN